MEIRIPVKIVEMINGHHWIVAADCEKKGRQGRISEVKNAPRMTAIANAIDPSTVLFVRSHCLFPYFFPIMLAFCQNESSGYVPLHPHIQDTKLH